MLSERFPPHISREVIRQCKDNKVWRENDTPDTIEPRLVEEYAELQYEIDVNPEIAFLVAGEIGDILYLALKYESMTGQITPKIELIVDEALAICELTGLNPSHCVCMKLMRNDLKYIPLIQNNGFNLQEAVFLSKTMYKKALGGDSWFSTMWEEYGEIITHDHPLELEQR